MRRRMRTRLCGRLAGAVLRGLLIGVASAAVGILAGFAAVKLVPSGSCSGDLCGPDLGPLVQAIHLTGIRHSRYAGIGKVHLEHIFAAVAINLIRLYAWRTGVPVQLTRTTHLTRHGLTPAA